MKVLIADDQLRRYGRLIDRLLECGLSRDDIQIVPSANDTRNAIDTIQFDLLILDILLPLWPEGEPDVQNALDLLFEIHEEEMQNKPRHILGITADKLTADRALTEFESLTWAVLEYSDSNDEWVNRAVNCARYIQQTEKGVEHEEYGIDLAIVCALAKPELEAVLKLPWNWSSPRPLNDVAFVHDGSLEIGGKTIKVCAAAAPRMGMVSTALCSATIISYLRPKLLAMCGICAGIKDKVNIGDVLFADPSWDFQSGKRVRDKENSQFSIRPHQLPAPTRVRTHVEQIRDDQQALALLSANFDGEAPNMTRVVLGPVASGSAVLADGEVVKEIKTQHGELVGVEMEIYGLFAAALGASAPQPMPFALKAVCDFADPDKEDQHQRYAAYASANVLRMLIERFGGRLLS